MENRVLYQQMSQTEKSKYNEEFLSFMSSDFNMLLDIADTSEKEMRRRTVLLKGFSLATAWPFCREFVGERIMSNDYGVTVCNRLVQYFNEIKKLIQPDVAVNAEINLKSESQSKPTTDKNGIPVRRRGRPTKAEDTEYKKAVKLKQERDDKLHPSLFPQPNEHVGTDADTVQIMYTMREYRWLLSEGLQRDVDGLRGMRTAFAEASQRAKFMAEQGAKASEVTLYAQEAKRLNKIIEDIYTNVDKELAEVCLRLKYDPHYIKLMLDRGVNAEEVRLALVPKYKSVLSINPSFKQYVMDKIAKEDPKLAKERKALADAKERVDAVRKYLLRTDKPATEKRISTMEKRIEELRTLDKKFPSLKIEPDAYLPVLEKTKETWELSLKNT